MAHLILLEDENILRKEISGYLAESGHQIDSVSNINDFRNTFRPDSHLIALIDLSLPDGDELELIAHLRAQGDQHGIIVITTLQRRLESGRVTLYWRIDAAKRQLIPPGKAPITLTAQGYAVLKTIVAGEGAPVDRRQIVAALNEDYLQYDQRRLDTQIHQLRKTILEISEMELPIRTARGRGYQTSAKFHQQN